MTVYFDAGWHVLHHPYATQDKTIQHNAIQVNCITSLFQHNAYLLHFMDGIDRPYSTVVMDVQ